MVTSPETIEFLMDLLQDAGPVSTRKMFGEYAIYLDGKVVGLVCDDRLFLKPTPAARALIAAPREGAPYPGAKPHLLIEDELDDPESLVRLIRAVAADLPPPKPKAPRQRR